MPAVHLLGRDRSRTRVFCLATITVVGVVLVWSRFANIGTSFWSDEAHSAYYFAGRGPHAIFFSTYVPNNHALYNLLSWITTGAFGRSEPASRFWSVVPGLIAVAIAAWWAWRRLGMIAATAVVVLMTVSPVHWALTTQARGYGLAMLAGLLMLIEAVRTSDHEATRDIVAFSIAALIGIWTLPVFAIPAIAHAAVLLCNPRIRRRVLLLCGAIAVGSLAFYAPMLGDILHNADQQFGSRLTVLDIATGAYHHMAAPTVGSALPGDLHSAENAVARFLVVALLAAAAVAWLWRRRERTLLAHLVVPVFGTYLVLFAGRFYVQPRFTSYLLFHIVVLLAIGAQAGWDALPRVTASRAVTAILLVAVGVVGTARIAHLVEAQAHLPWENHRFVADVANAIGAEKVYTDTTHPVADFYYLGRRRVVWLRRPVLKRRTFCKMRGRFMFVDDTYHGRHVNLSCLRRRHPVVIDVPQQTDPPIRAPGKITIYIVPSARRRR